MKLSLPLLMVSVAMLGSGCASTRRSVTHIRVDGQKAFVAYAEWDHDFLAASTDRSRVKRCAVNPDNSLACEEDADINHVLNPQEDASPPPKPAAAPAPEAAPEAAPAASEAAPPA